MTTEFDILYGFQELHSPILDKIMVAITWLGNSGIFWIIVTLAMLIWCRDKRAGWTSALALIFSLLVCNVLLKNLVARDRPCWIDSQVPLLIGNPRDFSFPSGHSSASFAAAISIVQYYRKPGYAAIGLAILIALSRLYLFVHFPTDVLAGVMLGTVEALAAGIIVRNFQQKNNLHSKK